MEKEKAINILTAKSGELHPHNFHCYYETLANYSELNSKLSIGIDFVCRYCGDSNRESFKKENAHTFPEFAGNKWLFSKDECKKCNQILSRYENELANYGHLMRSLFGMKTKAKKPAKFKNDSFSIFRDNTGIKMTLDSKKQELNPNSENEFKITHNFKSGKKEANIRISEKEYIPLYLFKALVKIAFATMPNEELLKNDFSDLKKFLLNEDFSFDDERHEPYFYIYHNRISFIERKPMLMLFKKHPKYEKFNIPTYSLLFCYGNQVFQIFLPYCSIDKWLLVEQELKIMVIPEIIIEKENKREFIWMNGFSREKTKYKSIKFKIEN